MPGKTRAKGKKNRVQTRRRRGKPQSKLSSLYTPRGIFKLAAISSVLGENIVINRFVRYAIGE